ncbi:MAG TPA: caspase family protein [Actinomycetes bacterium]
MADRHALILANSVYQDSNLARLRAPSHDAEALRRVLEDEAIGGFDVRVVTDAGMRDAQLAVVEFFTARRSGDLALLHFSGHGLKDPRGDLYFAARDTELRHLRATGVPSAFVNAQISDCAARRIVVMLDCCYSGAFAKGAVQRADRSVNLADEFRPEQDERGKGRVVLTASSSTQYAFDGDELSEADDSPSVFTTALVQGLRTGAADLDGDGEISVEDLYDYVYQEVRRRTPYQVPQKHSFAMEGELFIAHSVRPVELPYDLRANLESASVASRGEAVEELARWLHSPKRARRTAARTELEWRCRHDDSFRIREAAAAALATEPVPPSPPPTPVAAVAAAAPTEEAARAPADSRPQPPRQPIGVVPHQQAPTGGTRPQQAPGTASPAPAPEPAVATSPAGAEARRWREADRRLSRPAWFALVGATVGVYSLADDSIRFTAYLPTLVFVASAVCLLMGRGRRLVWAAVLLGATSRALGWLAFSVILPLRLHVSLSLQFHLLWQSYVLAELILTAGAVYAAVELYRHPGTSRCDSRWHAYLGVAGAAVGTITTLLAFWPLGRADKTMLTAYAAASLSVLLVAGLLRPHHAGAAIAAGWAAVNAATILSYLSAPSITVQRAAVVAQVLLGGLFALALLRLEHPTEARPHVPDGARLRPAG